MSRLLIISNRLPFTIERDGNSISLRQSSGGLVSAIKSYFENCVNDVSHTERIWVGSMECSSQEWEVSKQNSDIPSDFTMEAIFPEEKIYNNFYNGFSNSTLWPLFHYFPVFAEYRKVYFEDYCKVNQLFTDTIVSIYKPGDIIWVHDYQLMLVPDMLRKKLPDANIGFFLHIPFPSYEILRLLPTEWKNQLMQGVMGADLIGFHTQDYVQHFIHSAKMILQLENQFNNLYYGNRMVRTDQFPIGIDYKKFREACFDDKVVGICTAIEKKFYDQKLIFSVDRLDYTKGLNFRLDGYDHFLEIHPEWREKVLFILNIIPSRDSIAAYNDRKRTVEEKISTINGKYSTLQWQPIIYRYNHLSYEDLCALYQAADVALITPLRDGMNLVAKEYIASCIDKGVLILSELTGAASELNEAILVNPTDTEEVAAAIQEALVMPLVEQRSRLLQMQRRIEDYDVLKWINDFLEQLETTRKEQEALKVNVLKKEHTEQILHQFKKAEKRCILLDYDGTLTPYEKLPSMAAPGEKLLHLLSDLASDPQNEVVIISGRDVDTLEKWLGQLPLNLIAEHGACIKYKNQAWEAYTTINTEWKEQLRPTMQVFVNRCAGSFIEEKKTTLAWHYRNTNRELGFIRSRELRNTLLQLTGNTPLQVIDGNKVLEIRMTGVDKGATASVMLENLRPEFIMCIGDDATDEDMFRALRDKGYTIKIGRANTVAEFTILSQNEVYPFLQNFITKFHEQKHEFSK